MPHLQALDGSALSWAELHERRAAYYAWKAAQEQPPVQYMKRKSGTGWNWVRVK